MPFLRLIVAALVLGGLALSVGLDQAARVDPQDALASARPDVQSRVRQGPVRLVGRAFADDAGPWNPLGASLFWALWGEAHDPDRLDANLAHLAAHGVDYVRLLAMVGTPSWSDRVIDPAVPAYWTVADRLFQRLSRHNLRAQVVLFADAQVMMPVAADRQRFARAWVTFANARPEQLQMLEVANEYFQNGLDETEVRAVGDQIRAETTIPVTLGAAPADRVAALYGGWPSVAAMHYDRDQSGALGAWRPVVQPWAWPDAYRRDSDRRRLPDVVVNNEPIGPGSSVTSEDDPARIAAAYVSSFLAGHAAYVFHSGAGIRGGGAADLARGRSANFADEPAAFLDALSAWRARLPPGLANWQRVEPGASAFPLRLVDRAVARRQLGGAYGARSDGQTLMLFVDQRESFGVTAGTAMRVTVLDMLTGEVRMKEDLRAGQNWTLAGRLPATLVIASPAEARPAISSRMK